MNENRPNWIVPNSETKKMEKPPFYVVSPFKFWLLSIGTIGLYHFAWFIINWHRIAKASPNKKRQSIFNHIVSKVLFVRALFLNIDKHIQEQGIKYAWKPRFWATAYLFLILINLVMPYFSVYGYWSAIFPFWLPALCTFILLSAALFQAQLAINIACGDPKGQSNSKITMWHIGAILVVWFLFFAPIATVDVTVDLPPVNEPPVK